MKPIIGITADINDTQNHLNTAYVAAIDAAGGIPLILPASAIAVTAALEAGAFHGLLLSGGGDIEGRHFGQKTHEKAVDIWPARDEAEVAAARLAFARNMPILGICRGLQILNVALGGNIHQHIEGHRQDAPRSISTHSVQISGKLAKIMGAAHVMVNSTHHQAAAGLAAGLVACGHAPDGIIEALHAPDKAFVLAVQWHPEELTHMPEHFAIFKAFVQFQI